MSDFPFNSVDEIPFDGVSHRAVTTVRNMAHDYYDHATSSDLVAFADKVLTLVNEIDSALAVHSSREGALLDEHDALNNLVNGLLALLPGSWFVIPASLASGLEAWFDEEGLSCNMVPYRHNVVVYIEGVEAQVLFKLRWSQIIVANS